MATPTACPVEVSVLIGLSTVRLKADTTTVVPARSGHYGCHAGKCAACCPLVTKTRKHETYKGVCSWFRGFVSPVQHCWLSTTTTTRLRRARAISRQPVGRL